MSVWPLVYHWVSPFSLAQHSAHPVLCLLLSAHAYALAVLTCPSSLSVLALMSVVSLVVFFGNILSEVVEMVLCNSGTFCCGRR